ADVARGALDEADAADVVSARADTDPVRGTRAGARHRGVCIHLLGGPGRVDDAVDREFLREAVRRPHAELRPAIAIVADVAGHAGQVAAVEVVDTEGDDARPARVVPGIEVQRLVVVDVPADVVTGLVTRAVDGPRLEEERPA